MDTTGIDAAVERSGDDPQRDADAAEPGHVVEATGQTLEQAIASALAELGIARDEAEVEVLSRGSVAVPGERVSGAGARVRVGRMDEETRRGRELLEALLQLMDISARTSVRRAAPAGDGGDRRPPAILEVSGDDLGLLIGWRGETLRALQTVVNLMMGEAEAEGRRLVIDVERYRARREDQVREHAVRLAQRVKRTGERQTLDPMQPYERRAVHLALADDPGVRTESLGREPARRVVIYPTGPPTGGPPEPWERDRLRPRGRADGDRERRPWQGRGGRPGGGGFSGARPAR